jgi:hypothetical protein
MTANRRLAGPSPILIPITIGTTHHFIIFAPAMNFEQLTDMKERVEALRGYL